MKNNLIILIQLIILNNCVIAQNSKVYYRDLIGNGIYAPIASFEAGPVADDYGPRRTTDNFHGANSSDDAYSILYSPYDGTIVDVNHLTRRGTNYKQVVVDIEGEYRFLFGHLYDNNSLYYNGMNGETVTVKNMLSPNVNKWAQVFFIPNAQGLIDTFAIGQVSGCVKIGNDTLIVTNNIVNIVANTTPIGLLGKSSAVFYHLHLNTIPTSKDVSTSRTDYYNANPLEFVDYEQSPLDVKLFCETDSNKVEIKYPGSERTNLVLKPIMRTRQGPSYKRYNHIYDIEKVKFFLYNDFTGKESLIKGHCSDSYISEGGKLDSSLVNHVEGAFGDFTKTGVNSKAYNGNSGQDYTPYDLFHFSDWKTRIHKKDIQMPSDSFKTCNPNSAKVANCPMDSRYNDGLYSLYGEVTRIYGDTEYSDYQQIELDNWQPFIRKVKMKNSGGDIVFINEWYSSACGIELLKSGITLELAYSEFFGQTFNL